MEGKAKILTNDPAAFYVLFPGSLPGAERWEVVFKAGKLMIKPPPQKPSGSQTIHVSGNARVGMIVGQLNADIHTGPGGTRVLPRELPTIGLAVPSRVRVSDQR